MPFPLLGLRRQLGLGGCFGLALLQLPLAAGAGPDFARDIQPIFAEHCGHCHGVDAGGRQGGLRLDVRDAALAGGDSGTPAIVPGDPAASELLRRITATDSDELMPPAAEGKPLAAAQVAALSAWISAGAEYAPHWAFVTPRKPVVPAVAGAPHPIDAFVRSRIATVPLEPAPPADPATLCRRLHLDLVGLPPAPDELVAFERDGYEATVDRLLASPQFGEKWARHWLDAARYADSMGYESDQIREMWAWREWVIEEINADTPINRFIIEQVAGDLLPDATPRQIVATGFLRNSMTNEEGATIPEEFRMAELFDRVDCLGRAVLGLTTQCAQCHTHKYDPLTQEEYYGLLAFLNNSYEARSHVYTPEAAARLAAVLRQIEAVEDEIRTIRPDWEPAQDHWASGLAATLPDWTPLEAESLSSGELLTHPVQLADKSVLMLGHPDNEFFLVASPELAGATALQIEALRHRDLLAGGPARHEIWGLAEVKVSVQRPGQDWTPVPLGTASADFSAPQGGEGKELHGPVEFLVDGARETSWLPDRGPILRHQPSVAVVPFAEPLTAPPGSKLRLHLSMMGLKQYAGDRRMLGCFRASLTTAAGAAAPPVDHAAILAIRRPAGERTPADQAAIFAAWRKTVPDLADFNARIAALWRSVPPHTTTALHLAEREPPWTRVTHRLDRGVWDKPLEPIEPHVPAFLHPFEPEWPPNRLGLARWLVDPRSPLFPRVMVNQIWQAIFGAGLVESPDDFGTRSPLPEHRELLDWLAADLVERGFSRKQAIRQIVTSQTYRQSSRITPAALALDPANRMLARGPRFRVDAEVVRDLALAVSGLLSDAIGGPSIYPPVPQNMLDFNFHKLAWPEATGPDRYRRSVYVFRRRSMPDPVLTGLDAPTADIACLRRLRSNTPLAALAGLNETVFVEAARALALRILREAPADDADRLEHAFVLCTSRKPSAAEREELLAFVSAQRERLDGGEADARAIMTGTADGPLPLPAGTTPAAAAAWTLVARVLLNLDETVTKH